MGRRGFTLIETLVTIAIIIVMLAIALPLLGRARASARETRCLAAIRGAHQLVMAYSNDARELPPHGEYQPGTLSAGMPAVQIAFPEVGILEVSYFNQPSIWATIVAYWQKDAIAGATCPSSPGRMQSIEPPRDGMLHTGIVTSYYLSAAFYAAPSYWSDAPSSSDSVLGPQRLSDVRFASDKSLLYEHMVFHIRSEATRPTSPECDRSPVVFVDGHAASHAFRGVDAVTVAHDAESPMPFSHTPLGVHGRDRTSP